MDSDYFAPILSASTVAVHGLRQTGPRVPPLRRGAEVSHTSASLTHAAGGGTIDLPAMAAVFKGSELLKTPRLPERHHKKPYGRMWKDLLHRESRIGGGFQGHPASSHSTYGYVQLEADRALERFARGSPAAAQVRPRSSSRAPHWTAGEAQRRIHHRN